MSFIRRKNQDRAQEVKKMILSLSIKDKQSTILKNDDFKLIITYSSQRAKKDQYNREKGLRRLEKSLKTGKLTKSNINNKGYNKFLELDGKVHVKINPQNTAADAKWDGLKGYLTNSTLSKERILANYMQLWQIEKALRIAKTDLNIRPVFHYKQRRMEAHICLNLWPVKYTMS